MPRMTLKLALLLTLVAAGMTIALTGQRPMAALAATATTRTVIGTPNPTVYGQSVTFTAIINSPSATGSVSFFDGATLLGTGVVLAGSAVLTTSTLSVGFHTISANYSGDVA